MLNLKDFIRKSLEEFKAINAKLKTLPVANGGTGATTAAKARVNLGITPENIGAMPADHKSNSVWYGNLNCYINQNGHWLPGDTAQQLGSTGVRWNYVCLSHSPNVSSDRRLKANIQGDMSKYVDMLEHIKPCTYGKSEFLHEPFKE